MNNSLSPLDGRYAEKISELSEIFSEFGLVKNRVKVEILWLEFLSEKGIISDLSKYKKEIKLLKENFSEDFFQKIKNIEKKTNHDVKAVEYFIQKFLPKSMWHWIHFACTSEDINNISYGFLFEEGREIILDNLKKNIFPFLIKKCEEWKKITILSRTHGQPATPSTMGKEFCVFLYRITKIFDNLKNSPICSKINGATGNFAAHKIAFDEKNWTKLSQEFIEKKCYLTWNPCTTQIESHDAQAEILNHMSLMSSIFIDFCRDIWGYISLGYFGQKMIKNEVGSSTMPHKINPIDFENAEGNFKLSRGISRTLADELPISRWQRDLTDSTLQRNFGLVFGHFLLGLKSFFKGLQKLELRNNVIQKDLDNCPEILTEAIQIILRKNGHNDAYEQLKNFSRGKILTKTEIKKFIDQSDLPVKDKNILKNLTPQNYIGESAEIVDFILQKINL